MSEWWFKVRKVDVRIQPRDGVNDGRYEYRASIMTTEAPVTPTTPQPTQVAEIPVPAAVDVPEPVYVDPEPPAPYVPPPPACQPVYAIFKCGPAGEIIWL